MKNTKLLLKINKLIQRMHYSYLKKKKLTDTNIIANKFCEYFTDIVLNLAKTRKMPQNINVQAQQARKTVHVNTRKFTTFRSLK